MSQGSLTVPALAGALAAAFIAHIPAAAAGPVADQIRPPQLSGNIPTVVADLPPVAPAEQQPFFDRFAWQSFIAVMWPALPDAHGEPVNPDNPAQFNNFKQVMGGAQTALVPVWLTYKDAFELYRNGTEPVPWTAPNVPTVCRNPAAQGATLLHMLSKADTVLDGLDQAFASPLPDQTGRYTRYEIRVNRVHYEFVRDNRYYLRANIPKNGVNFPASTKDTLGPVTVKAAWRDLSKVPERFHNRFYTVNALVVEPETCSGAVGADLQCDCTTRKMGLVGMHIVQKLADFPQWVWATFEQVDNLGDPTTPKGMAPSYFDPAHFPGGPLSNPSNHPDYSYQPEPVPFGQPLPKDPEPVNVVRLRSIPPSTAAVNVIYRKALAGTVWENYQLVVSQWPTEPQQGPIAPLPGGTDFGCNIVHPVSLSAGAPFPPCAQANITMETYFQFDSCMNCHAGAARDGTTHRTLTDFSWIMALRAYPPQGE